LFERGFFIQYGTVQPWKFDHQVYSKMKFWAEGQGERICLSRVGSGAGPEGPLSPQTSAGAFSLGHSRGGLRKAWSLSSSRRIGRATDLLCNARHLWVRSDDFNFLVFWWHDDWNRSDNMNTRLIAQRYKMDEQRTLSILGWTMASVLMVIFVLNAVALSGLEWASSPV
jgi:hypothetical protein